MSEYVMKLNRCTFLGLYFFAYALYVQFSFLTLFWCTVLFFSHLTSHQIQCLLNILAEIVYPYVMWYIYFCWFASLCTFVGAFYVFDVWKPWYMSYQCHIIIIFWYYEVLNLGPMHNYLNPSSILQNIKSPMNY